MADTVLRTLVTSFEADTAGMETSVAALQSTVGSATASMSADINSLESIIDTMTKSGAASITAIGLSFSSLAVGGFGAVAGLVAELTGVGASLEKIGNRAQDLRLSENFLLALGVAAATARVSTDEYNKALDKFTEVSKQSEDKSNSFYAALKNVGDEFVTAFKDAPSQAARLQVLGKAFNSTSDEVKRLQLAQNAFGTQSERVIGLFSQLADGTGALEAKAAALGLVLDQAMIKKANDAQAQAATLSTVLKDKLLVVLGDLMPAAKNLIPYFEQLAKAFSYIVQVFGSAQNMSAAVLVPEMGKYAAKIDESTARLDELKAKRDALLAQPGGSTFSQRLHGDTPDMYQRAIDQEEINLDKLQTHYADLNANLKSRQANEPKPGDANKPPPAFKTQPKLTGEDKDSFDKTVDSLNKHVAALEADQLAVGKDAAETAKLKAELALLQALQRAGSEVTNEQIETYTKLRASMSAQQALAGAGIQLNKDHAESFTEVTKRISDAAASLQKAKMAYEGQQEVIKTLGNDAVDIIANIGSKSETTAQQLQNMAKALEKMLLQAALLGEGPFAKLLGLANPSGGVGGILGLLGGGAGGGSGGGKDSGVLGQVLAVDGGAHAGGGDIPAGTLGIAGEHGLPELIRGPATVIPASQLGGGGGQTNHFAHISVSVDGARGNMEIQSMVHAGVTSGLTAYDAILPAKIADVQRRHF
jgi:hypothetical protein